MRRKAQVKHRSSSGSNSNSGSSKGTHREPESESAAGSTVFDDALTGNKKMTLPQLDLAMTAAVAGAVIAFWVVSFPRCIIMHPVGECTWMGLTVKCLPAIDLESPWDYHLAHWLLAGALFTIGAMNALAIDWKKNFVTTAATSGYALVTAVFAITRAQYGVSKPLLIGAALHNLFEWVFVATITQPTYAAKKRMISKTTLWIGFVIVAVLLIPDTKIATLAEQSVGIMLDFFLVFGFFELAVMGPDAEVRSFYLLPFVSTAVHLFFTIFPLVFANFVVGAKGYFVVVNETMIYLSPLVTHGIYYVWGQRFDKRCNAKGDIEPRFMVGGAKFKLAIGFCMGLIPLIGIASHSGSCLAPTVLTGTTVARVNPGLGDAFIDRIAQFKLVETAKDADGCIDYVLARNIQDPDEFRFIEKWESAEAVTQWMQQGLPVELFRNDPVMHQLLVGGKLQVQGAYMDVQPPKEIARGGVAFSMGSACTKVWDVVGNWNDCSWVIGCTRAEVHNATVRTLHFKNGQQLKCTLYEMYDDAMSLKYGFPGYEGHVSLATNATSGGCSATYAFRTDGGQAKVDDVYADFLTNRIPALQKMFSS
jgi:quinol monooxygenase YgiN